MCPNQRSVTTAQNMVIMQNSVKKSNHNASTVLKQATVPNGNVATRRNALTAEKTTTQGQRHAQYTRTTAKLNSYKNAQE